MRRIKALGSQLSVSWLMLMALVASTPAFYDSLMPIPANWANAMYALSGILVFAAAWKQPRVKVDWLLGAALIACAVLPPSSQSIGALSWRMTIAMLTLLRFILLSKPLFQQAGLARLMAMAAAVLGMCGVGFYWVDPSVETLGDGLWLAFSTAATVGYGDMVPSTTASRIFSVFVVLLGYGVLSLVTASVAAMFVDTQERQVEREILNDLHAQLKSVRQEIALLREVIDRQHKP